MWYLFQDVRFFTHFTLRSCPNSQQDHMSKTPPFPRPSDLNTIWKEWESLPCHEYLVLWYHFRLTVTKVFFTHTPCLPKKTHLLSSPLLFFTHIIALLFFPDFPNTQCISPIPLQKWYSFSCCAESKVIKSNAAIHKDFSSAIVFEAPWCILPLYWCPYVFILVLKQSQMWVTAWCGSLTLPNNTHNKISILWDHKNNNKDVTHCFAMVYW